MEYLMENEEEAFRLDIKTNSKVVEQQALWAGIKPGMHVADMCCGSGKVTSILHKLVQPGGVVIGFDGSEKRIEYAKERYNDKGITFKRRDIRKSLGDEEMFDFVWMRFALEYYLSSSFDIVKDVTKIIKPDGILCLVDLDHNCLSHFGISPRLERTIFAVMKYLEKNADFDPYVGRKLYSFLYDLGYQDINIDVTAHHLIFGELNDIDAYNWTKKFEVIAKKVNYDYEEYEGGYEEFLGEFNRFFINPRRFTYTPVICCRGRKPVA